VPPGTPEQAAAAHRQAAIGARHGAVVIAVA
jgi:hypothetical protein